MKAPIRIRMTAWYVGLLAAVMIAVAAFVVVRLRADLTAATDRTLQPAVGQIATGYAREGVPEFRDTSATVLSGERAAAQIITPGGRVLASYGDTVARQPMVAARERARIPAGSEETGSRELGRSDDAFRVVARATQRRGRSEIVVGAVSLDPVARSVHSVLVLVALALPAALAATAAGGWWLARRALRPVDRMTRAAAAFGPGQLDKRVAVPQTEDEVAHLAETLNRMLAQIEHGMNEQRRLVADTSHELRTPLAAMRSEIDVSLRADDLSPAARDVLESVRDEVDRMSAITDDLLILASADEGALAVSREPTDLHELAERVARSLRGLAERNGIALQVEGAETLAEVDPERFQQVLRNVVANALDFSPPDANVTIATYADGGVVEVAIADEGPGVPPELRERIFDRFFRIDQARTRRSGGGLGLAIAREVVHAHGGTIKALENEPRGTRITIRIPAPEALRLDQASEALI
ncbi:MAG TPA: ATP-binding protein [Thermoleophilaceae bacterium]|nr:ATP-binding protein [Thermoleophilaceae bacterium]